MEHDSYAGVYMLTSEPSLPVMPTKMELFCLDNIRVSIPTESCSGDKANIFSECDTEMCAENTEYSDLAIYVKIGENLMVTAYENTCEIYMLMNEFNDGEKSNEGYKILFALFFFFFLNII